MTIEEKLLNIDVEFIPNYIYECLYPNNLSNLEQIKNYLVKYNILSQIDTKLANKIMLAIETVKVNPIEKLNKILFKDNGTSN